MRCAETYFWFLSYLVLSVFLYFWWWKPVINNAWFVLSVELMAVIVTLLLQWWKISANRVP
jgi:hypothetical protein